MMSEHSVQDEEQFAHTGGKGDLFGLSSLEETLVEYLDHRVMSRCH